MERSPGPLRERLREFPAVRALRHRDFRLLWIGAFFSFTGSWVQNVAQGWLVFELTKDEAKLALVAFCQMVPVFVFGMIAGSLVDTMNRRFLLTLSQSVFATSALFLAWATATGTIAYWQILVVSLVNGLMSTIEIPARQSLLSRVVPPDDLPAAVPINALTFNAARMIGPAIGGFLLAKFGVQTCYLVNGLSYAALILAVIAIRADLSAETREPAPIKDLVLEGVRYTLRDVRLRALFMMECCTSMFGIFYLTLMPAIAKELLGLGKVGLGNAMTSVGVGAVIGLASLAGISHLPIKPLLIRLAMTVLGLGLVGLTFASTPWMAFPILALIGMASVVQFNTTNTLFQLLSPPNLRGRVIAMHVWALSGLSPFGTLFFGWLASVAGLRIAIGSGAIVMLFGTLLAWIHRGRLAGVH